MAVISQDVFHGLAAWRLESELLRVVIVPQCGGKIVSLYDKRAGFEWLAQPRTPLKPAPYGSVFVEQDMSGWDETFPTIDACSYPVEGQYLGRLIPDHGELWSLPWERVELRTEKLFLSVNGRALPYRFWRIAWLEQPDCLCLDYSVQNTGMEPIQTLWAAHPQFAATVDTQIILPETAGAVINVIPGPIWGAAGARHPWPEAVAADGSAWRLDRVGPAERRDFRKFYLPPEQPVSWAGIDMLGRGCSLRMHWQTTEVAYLGIWVDEGAINSAAVVALEPANGFYDSLTLAIENKRAMQLEPGETQTWSLKVSISNLMSRLPPIAPE